MIKQIVILLTTIAILVSTNLATARSIDEVVPFTAAVHIDVIEASTSDLTIIGAASISITTRSGCPGSG